MRILLAALLVAMTALVGAPARAADMPEYPDFEIPRGRATQIERTGEAVVDFGNFDVRIFQLIHFLFAFFPFLFRGCSI